MSTLTDMQLRFWAERGYLIVKAAFSPADISELRDLTEVGLASPEARRRFRSVLDEVLQSVVRDLAGEDVVTLDVARDGPASRPFHCDTWRAHDANNQAISLLVALTDIAGETAPLFFPGSHRIASASASSGSKDRTSDEMVRLATWLADDRQKAVGLTCAAGDVWVRHPALFRGSISGGGDPWLGLEARCVTKAGLAQHPATADIFGSA